MTELPQAVQSLAAAALAEMQADPQHRLAPRRHQALYAALAAAPDPARRAAPCWLVVLAVERVLLLFRAQCPDDTLPPALLATAIGLLEGRLDAATAAEIEAQPCARAAWTTATWLLSRRSPRPRPNLGRRETPRGCGHFGRAGFNKPCQTPWPRPGADSAPEACVQGVLQSAARRGYGAANHRSWKKAVLAGGQGAWGIVRKIEGTGMAINNEPYRRLILEVHPPAGAPFEARFELPEFRVATLSSGDNVYVKFDPQNHKHITLADPPHGAHPAGGPKPRPGHSQDPLPDLPSQLERLAKLHAAGHLTAEEFEAAKRQLLG